MAAGATHTSHPIVGTRNEPDRSRIVFDARDEDYWRPIQQAFPIDRSILNFNNGGCCPSPSVVLDAQRRHIEFSNHLPTRQMWHVLGPGLETVRTRIARNLGVSHNEIALTRNASEAIEIVQYGIPLKAGDEVVSTTHDYPNMLVTWKQRAAREGIVFKQVPFSPPASLDQLFNAVTGAVTDRTRVILISHITFTTGQIFPVARICDFARARNIECIVDGAHAYGQFDFAFNDLHCDYYGVSLHKWILAPVGVGFLYVRKSKIPGLWPLFGSTEPQSEDIRKFETYGTHPFANKLAASEALTFHETIGGARKAARLFYLRSLWVAPLREFRNVIFYTSDDPATSAAIGTVGFLRDGAPMDPGMVAEYLFARHRIVVTTISIDGTRGIRITPNIYTTTGELAMLADALVEIAKNGIPADSAAWKKY